MSGFFYSLNVQNHRTCAFCAQVRWIAGLGGSAYLGTKKTHEPQ